MTFLNLALSIVKAEQSKTKWDASHTSSAKSGKKALGTILLTP